MKFLSFKINNKKKFQWSLVRLKKEKITPKRSGGERLTIEIEFKSNRRHFNNAERLIELKVFHFYNAEIF